MSNSEIHEPGALQATILRAGILAIGDEVLRGEVVNSNAAFLGDRLFGLGFEVTAHEVVSDEPEAIARALVRLSQAVELVVATGGLGPTDDDRTVDVVAKLLGVGRVQDEPSLATMRAWFTARNYELTPNNLRQVEIPAGAEPLSNAAGLAPGFAVTLGQARCFFLPGVPREMRRIFVDHVAPRAAELLRARGGAFTVSRTFRVYGMGESHVDHRLKGLLDGLSEKKNVSLHFRTLAPENHVRLIVRDREAARAQALLDRLDIEVRKRLGAAIYGIDDETFVSTVRRTFLAAKSRLGLAESCTGGLCGQLVTHEPGASDFFAGSIVSYENTVKERVLGVPAEVLREYGAVSEPCARAMAEGALRVLNVDVAVAITGVAGDATDALGSPSDVAAGPRAVPVGTVCFGVARTRSRAHTGTLSVAAGRAESVTTETHRFSGGRERVRLSAAHHALELARRALLLAPA